MTAGLALLLLLAPAVCAQSLNYATVASRIVDALKLSKGERVLARFDPATFPELVPLLEERVRARGAVSLPPVSIDQPLPSLDGVDVYLYLPLSRAKRDLPAEERKALAAWLDRGGARRQIHFHWADGSRAPDGLPGEHTSALDAAYQDALDIDYAALSAAQERTIRLLRSGSVRIYTPAGTDFFFRVGQRPFNKQNGDASAERMKTARVRVDREIELPAGVLRVAPVEETAAGVIVIPEARFGGTLAKKVALYFDNGRISRVRAEQGQAAVEAALKADGDAAYWFREFGLGFNPKLSGTSYYGYGAGVVRLSLGDNEELGGKVRGGFYRWLLFPDATVEVDGTYLVRNGKLIVP